jgi:retron-type reverse transcriptase
MRKILLIIALVLVSWVSAQEINCTVTINSDMIEGTNKQVYETLKAGIEEYMNQNRWTNMTYADNEKIECSMLIVVKKVEGEMYTCEMTLQSRRPVYGTTYMTPILNFKDGAFNFAYK